MAIAIERKGFVSERCELNRRIRKDNSLLHSLSETVKYIWKIIQLAIPRLADAMEEARVNMLVFEYCRRKAKSERVEMQQQVSHSKEILAQANTLIDQIHIKESEYTTLEAERKKTPFIFAAKRKEISAKLQKARLSIRDKKEDAAERKLKKMYGLCIFERFEESLQTVAEHLGEEPLEEKTPRKQSLKEYFEEHRTTQKEKSSEKTGHPKKRAHRDEEERL